MKRKSSLNVPCKVCGEDVLRWINIPSVCKSCQVIQKAEYDKVHRHKNKERINAFMRARPRERVKSYELKTRYGITLEDYYVMLEQQNGRCVICKTDSPRNDRSEYFFVDHCHETDKVRGLLCHHCNYALGGFQDNILILESAIKYLKDT